MRGMAAALGRLAQLAQLRTAAGGVQQRTRAAGPRGAAWAAQAAQARPQTRVQWRSLSALEGPGAGGASKSPSEGLSAGGSSQEPSPLHFEFAQRALDIMNGSFDDNEARRRRQRKNEVLAKRPQLKRHELDCGSSEVQIAHMTGRIQYLQEHLEKHTKDLGSRRGLDRLITKRYKLLAYLRKTNEPRFLETIKALRITMPSSLDTTPKYGRRAKHKRKKMRGRDVDQ